MTEFFTLGPHLPRHRWDPDRFIQLILIEMKVKVVVDTTWNLNRNGKRQWISATFQAQHPIMLSATWDDNIATVLWYGILVHLSIATSI